MTTRAPAGGGPTLDPSVIDHPGVLVVGAGATGLITALELHRRGVPSLVLERESACAMQSGQCHGWLHRGAVFPEAADSEVAELAAGADWWQEAAERRWLIEGEVLGTDPDGADRVTRLWTQLSVAHSVADLAEPPLNWSVRGGEPSVVPSEVLRAAATAAGVVVRAADVRELLPGPDRRYVGGVRVTAGPRALDVRAPVVVLAAGSGISRLVPSAAVLSERLSFMLVVRSEEAPARAFTVPEQQALGLMVVPRDRAGRRHLLVSNFVSYAATAEVRHARRAWLHGVGATVRELLPRVWTDPDALWGTYGAVKVERERQRQLGLGVPGAAVLDTPFKNVLAGVPGKLVLAPVLAAHISDRCVELLASGRGGEVPSSEWLDALLPQATWGPEAWQLTPLMSRGTVFSAGEAA